MKVTAKGDKSKGYPKLMFSSSDLIVLFSRTQYGTVLVGDNNHKTGDFLNSWDMICFEDYTGEITLSNY